MRKNKRILRNLASIVNHIVVKHLVVRWDSHRRHLVALTKIVINNFIFSRTLIYFSYMRKVGRPVKNGLDKKVKYGISIEKYLFDRMKSEESSVSKFIQKLVKNYYEKKDVR